MLYNIYVIAVKYDQQIEESDDDFKNCSIFVFILVFRKPKKASVLSGGHCLQCLAPFVDIHATDRVCRHHPGFIGMNAKNQS